VILYPAIDIKNAAVVRLVQGRMDDATVFHDDPADQAKIWQAAGFDWVHVVDLNGAVDGDPVNSAAIAAILQATSCSVQLGGGIRSMARAEHWMKLGVSRLVLGTAAVRDPAFVGEAAAAFPGQIAVGLDCRDGKVAVDGWVAQTDADAVDIARAVEDAGVAALIVTDIARDGRSTGVNVAFTGQIADAVEIPVIASGGLASVDEIATLKAREGHAIAGVVIGRSLYDGRVDPKAALAAAA